MTRDAQPSLTARQKLSKQPKEDEEKFSQNQTVVWLLNFFKRCAGTILHFYAAFAHN